MIRLPKEPEILEEDVLITSLDISPAKTPKSTERSTIKNTFDLTKTLIEPYRPRAVQTKLSRSRKIKSVIYSVDLEPPATSIGFPKRINKSPGKPIPRLFMRTSSLVPESITVKEIENIERVQKLIPFKPYILYQTRPQTHRRSSISAPSKDSCITLGLLKASAHSRSTYRKYVKQTN